jgi:hypothetical protein
MPTQNPPPQHEGRPWRLMRLMLHFEPADRQTDRGLDR